MSDKTFIEKLWDFLSGKNRNPKTADIMKALLKGDLARREVHNLYKHQEEIEKRRKEVYRLKKIIETSDSSSKLYKRAMIDLNKLLNQ